MLSRIEVEKTTLDTLSRMQKQWYRIGGVAAFVLAIGYIIIIPLYAHVGAPPNGGEAWFKYLPGKTTIWWSILGLCVFTDFVYMPVAFALYLALKELNRNLMLLAIAFVGLFVVLDLAVTWSHNASVLTLYTGTTPPLRVTPSGQVISRLPTMRRQCSTPLWKSCMQS